MDTTWKPILRQQFGAALEMLGNALEACPDELWTDRTRRPQFWYVVYHALFFTDLYLSGSAEGFAPPQPFTLAELDPAGRVPDRAYGKDELRGYLTYCRAKSVRTIDGLTAESAQQRGGFSWVDLSAAELLLYNMRHVQHHAAQLNLMLRQTVGVAPVWVARARKHEPEPAPAT